MGMASFSKFGPAAAALAALGLWTASALRAEDWPTYRHDNARSGVTPESLALPLAELWTYVPPAEPTPAWAVPQPGLPELPKLDFDDAFHVAVAGDSLFFGSSVDNGVHALEAATGRPRWSFFTEGAVRLAPSVAAGRVYAGSDDGAVYCLDAREGRALWTVRPMPGSTRILGAGRRMSLWPVRTGVLVDAGVAYCGAGVFPARGTAVLALDAGAGRTLWKTSEIIRESYVSLAPQGYLVASADQVFVPNGRSSPLTYARADGAILGTMDKDYEIVKAKGVVSGGYGVLIDSIYYVGSQNVLHGYLADGSHTTAVKEARQIAASPERYYRLSGQVPPPGGRPGPGRASFVSAFDRNVVGSPLGRGPFPGGAAAWTYTHPGLQALIVAGGQVVAGGEDVVILLDGATGKPLWKAPVEGRARGLAVANGRLFVSTDRGRIHAFGAGAPAPKTVARAAEPFPTDDETPRLAALAGAIAKEAGPGKGFGLVLGREAPRLAWELARRTGLLVHAVEPDPAKAVAARAALAAAGVYGVRVLVDGVSPESTNGLPYPTYFANLIVVRDGAPAGVSSKAVLKCLKPCGGVLYAAPAAAPGDGWARAGAAPAGQLAGEAGWVKLVRGPLPGARDWTHQYADAGNSGSSDDEFLRGKPEVLWYGEPGPDKMQDRHLRSEAPLSLDGRVYCQGLRYREGRPLLLCFDAYNGVPYWEREVPGAQRIQIQNDCGNLAVSRAGLFVAVSNRCLRLDLATGATVQTLDAPGAAGRPWAYVAVEGDRLAGSVLSSPQFSDIVFAYDTTTGRLAWRRDGGPVRNSTLAVCGGRLFFVENRAGKKTEAPADPLAAQARAKAAERRGEAPPPEATVRTVVALDLATGRELWARDVDLAGCGGWASSLNLIAKRGVVLLSGTYSAYGKPKGTEDARRAVALSAADGALLWNEPIGNRVRPVVVKDRIVARPRAFDLQTGAPVMKPGSKKPIPWTMVNLGACGQIAASAELLFFRDGVTAITDVKTGMRVMSFIGMRPGCLINIVPAGGVAVQVESSSGCVCAHPLQGTIAFAPLGAE